MEEDGEEEEAGEPTAQDLDAEARDLLQWPELSAQVRAFTATTLGMRACTPSLPLGATPEESATLLAGTTAAATLRDKHGGFPRDVFEGTKDVRPWIAGAARGRVLSGSSLADVATTAAACAKVHALIHAPDDDALEPLRRLAAPLIAIPEELEHEIRRCVAVPGGNVLDDASEKLASIRVERRETERELRALLQQKAQYMQKKNFAERAQIVIRLGRECVPIKAGAQSEMDGVILDSSSTGQTVFKEPAEAVPLNNRILELANEEDAEVERVLSALTSMVVGGDGGKSILNATEAMAGLDLASARASHARWLLSPSNHAQVQEALQSGGMLTRALFESIDVERKGRLTAAEFDAGIKTLMADAEHVDCVVVGVAKKIARESVTPNCSVSLAEFEELAQAAVSELHAEEHIDYDAEHRWD